MARSFENELNKLDHDDLYAEMYEALFGLQDDFDQYRGKIDEALMLITIMEQRQAEFIKKYGESPPHPATIRRNGVERTNKSPEQLYYAEGRGYDARQKTEEQKNKRHAEGSSVRDYEDTSVCRVQQQMRLAPDSPKYPAYASDETSLLRGKPDTYTVPTVYSSKSVKVPEKYLYEDSRESILHADGANTARGRIKKAEKKRKVSRKVKPDKGDSKPKTKKQQRIERAKDAAFYLVLVLLVSTVLVVNVFSGDGVRSFAGFSGFIVKSSSMEDVYPKNSLILTRRIEPAKLTIGDDITFFSNSTTTITHRVVGIYENYEQTGQRGFETKGTMNEKPDKDIVPAVNVIGKVVFCSAFIGSLLLFIGKNWPLMIFFALVITALILVLRKILKS